MFDLNLTNFETEIGLIYFLIKNNFDDKDLILIRLLKVYTWLETIYNVYKV